MVRKIEIHCCIAEIYDIGYMYTYVHTNLQLITGINKFQEVMNFPRAYKIVE